MAQTIVQRVQRVTLQMLVKNLGLTSKILRWGAKFESPQNYYGCVNNNNNNNDESLAMSGLDDNPKLVRCQANLS